MVDDDDDVVEPEQNFELIGAPVGDLGGLLRLRYGTGPQDPMPFVLTLTQQYVARETGKTPPVSFPEMTKFAEQNALMLEAIARFEWRRGYTTHELV
jgi:hypothetical protein